MTQFKKHSQENKKDHKLVDEMTAMWNSTKRTFKNYQRLKVNGTDTQRKVNPVIEAMYHHIVETVKELYSKLPNKEDRVMVELNLKSCPTDPSGLYCILTQSFFFYLECDVRTNYKIEYQFHQCPFEDEIQKLINKYSLKSYSTEIMKQPDYPSFFKRTLQVQPENLIHIL